MFSAVSIPATRPAALKALLSFLVPTLLGMGMLWLVGFAPYPQIHDAFHDIRHTAGFPCH